MARFRKKKVDPTVKVEEKPKKPPSEFQIRARKENLKKARRANDEKRHKKEMVALDERLNNLGGEIDETVEKQVKEQLGKLDRKKLKDEVLQVFYDMGGKRAMKKWAKDNPGKFYTLMANILKVDSDKGDGGGSGVTVNLFGLEPDSIDITPNKT